MREAYGDAWNLARGKVLCILTNGVVKQNGAAVMGRGIALEAAVRFPELPYKLGRYIKQYGNRAFNLGQWGEYRIVAYPTKHDWRAPADKNLILQSAKQLIEMANKFGWKEIILPRPGCGNGQLNWADVKLLLEKVLDSRFTIVWK